MNDIANKRLLVVFIKSAPRIVVLAAIGFVHTISQVWQVKIANELIAIINCVAGA